MKSNIFKYSFALISTAAIICCLSSCKDDDAVIGKVDYSYFPLKTDNYIIYDVVEIAIDDTSNLYDTLRYEIKEIVGEEFIDDTNEPAFRIERYYREHKSYSKWTIKDVWSAKLTRTNAQKNEENTRYLKLGFPATLNKRWDGNTLNINNEEEYKISDIDSPESINDIAFDSVLTVTQLDIENLIEKKYAVEKYAKNIGLVYKEKTIIKSKSPNRNIPIEDRILTATIYTQKVIDYKVN